MKTIRWIVAAAAVGAAGVALLVADADAGDPIVLEKLPEQVLTAPQLTQYRDWALTVWPNSSPANISDLRCCRNRLCTIRWKQTLTAAQYNTAEDTKVLYRPPRPGNIAADGSSADYVELANRSRLDWDDVNDVPDPQGELSALGDITASVFGVSKPLLECVHIWTVYDTEDADEDGDIDEIIERRGEVLAAAQKTPVNRLLCLKDETCRRRIGTVVE